VILTGSGENLGLVSESALEYSASDCRNRCSLLVCQWLTPPGGAAPEVPPPGGHEVPLQTRLQRAVPPPGFTGARCISVLFSSSPFLSCVISFPCHGPPPPGGEPDPAPPGG